MRPVRGTKLSDVLARAAVGMEIRAERARNDWVEKSSRKEVLSGGLRRAKTLTSLFFWMIWPNS